LERNRQSLGHFISPRSFPKSQRGYQKTLKGFFAGTQAEGFGLVKTFIFLPKKPFRFFGGNPSRRLWLSLRFTKKPFRVFWRNSPLGFWKVTLYKIPYGLQNPKDFYRPKNPKGVFWRNNPKRVFGREPKP